MPRRTPDAYTIAIVKPTSSSCRSVTYTHRPCPSASDYGVSKHVAGAIVHEPVPYSTSLRTQAHPSSKRSEYIRQAAAYDECQTKPRLDPPVQFLPLLLIHFCTPLPLRVNRLCLCHCFAYFQGFLFTYRVTVPQRNIGIVMAGRRTRGHKIVYRHTSVNARSFMLCEHRDRGCWQVSSYHDRSWPMRRLCGTVRSR